MFKKFLKVTFGFMILAAILIVIFGAAAGFTVGETVLVLALLPFIGIAFSMFLLAVAAVIGWILLAFSYAAFIIFFWLIVAAIAAVVMSVFGLV